MGILMISAIIVVLANLIADLAYAFVDPRIKY
jgi:ABC-type dipeptide/oligopeptide/nickel transport system permease component